MTQQLHPIQDQARFIPPSRIGDPVTGTGLTVENESFETGRSSENAWGVAARWLAFAFLMMFAIVALYWASPGKLGGF